MRRVRDSACPVLATLSPCTPGVLDVSPDGDVSVPGYGPLLDCPPEGYR